MTFYIYQLIHFWCLEGQQAQKTKNYTLTLGGILIPIITRREEKESTLDSGGGSERTSIHSSTLDVFHTNFPFSFSHMLPSFHHGSICMPIMTTLINN